MNLLKKSIVLALLSVLSIGANAEFIETDYLNYGDGLSTLHEETGVEWLDFTETMGHSYNSLSSSLDTDFVGWRFPTESEVLTMYASFFPNITMTNYGGYSSGFTAQEYAQFLGFFGATDTSRNRTYAFYLDDDDDVLTSGANHSFIHYASARGHSDFTTNYSTSGYLLVSDGGVTLGSRNDPSMNANNQNAPVNEGASSVPLPASVGLLALAMLGFSARRKNG